MKKITLSLVMSSTFFFSGCVYQTHTAQLENQNMRQSTLIRQQQNQINELQQRLEERATKIQAKKETKRKAQITAKIAKTKTNISTVHSNKVKTLKEVEDKNYSSKYMYPKTKKTSIPKPKVLSSSITMTKSECISMITKARFDKYTSMFGSETASIKRCKMLKAMR